MPHMGVAKQYLLNLLADPATPLDTILKDWKGTREDAIAEIENDPREVFAACSCVKRPNGACSGLRHETQLFEVGMRVRAQWTIGAMMQGQRGEIVRIDTRTTRRDGNHLVIVVRFADGSEVEVIDPRKGIDLMVES
jgi:hypothetical protein